MRIWPLKLIGVLEVAIGALKLHLKSRAVWSLTFTLREWMALPFEGDR